MIVFHSPMTLKKGHVWKILHKQFFLKRPNITVSAVKSDTDDLPCMHAQRTHCGFWLMFK